MNLGVKLISSIFITLTLILFEVYAFQCLKYTVSYENFWLKSIIFGFFWGFTFLTISRLLFRTWSPGNPQRSERTMYFDSVLIGIFIGKLVLFLGKFMDDVIRLIRTIYYRIQGLDTTVSSWTELLVLFSILSISLVFILVQGMIGNPYRYRLHRHRVESEKWPKSLNGLKIVQISDIHAGSFMPNAPIEKGIQMINDLDADLVFFTGDLVNNMAQEIEPFIAKFKNIKAKYGVFAILGNHDYGDYVRWPSVETKQKNLKNLIHYFELLGWDLLMNEHRVLKINQTPLTIVGVENLSANGRFSKYGDLAKAYSGSDESPYKLLLSHDPSHWKFDVLKKYQDILITFSGHTHGAQFGFEFGSSIKWSPVQYFYKEWAGIYNSDGQYLHVNRGFGFLGYPGRVGILPEITLIELFNQ